MLNIIKENRLLPVYKVNSLEEIDTTVPALIDYGINVVEVVFRNDLAGPAIKKISAEYPDVLIGAGSVSTIEDVDTAINNGAKFIVTPGINEKIIKYCQSKDVLIIPGCAIPSDIETAINNNISTVKFFPAELNGGLKMLNAISGPYNTISFIPTGGINLSNIREYLDHEAILAVGGSFMFKGDINEALDKYNEVMSR